MIKKVFTLLVLLVCSMHSFCQDGPNFANDAQLSPSSQQAGEVSGNPVNLFTGIPGISVPIYNYSNSNGLRLSVTADYFAGGIKDGQSATTIGLGWYLNAGGTITRTVRGMNDDLTTYGYMYASSIPADPRNNYNKYYYDSLDGEQDIFEFDFNGRSGKFFIGKNGQVLVIPSSKLKILYTTNPGLSGHIMNFTIIAEDGTKYFFNDQENTYQNITQGNGYYRSGFTGYQYTSAWYLSQIIAPFSSDTIKLNYNISTVNTAFSYPQAAFFNSSNDTTANYQGFGQNVSQVKKISSIVFPDKKTINFYYENSNSYVYEDTDKALSKIQISDSVFRYGYVFDYQTSYTGLVGGFMTTYATKLLLKSITPYTSEESSKPYQFAYYNPYPDSSAEITPTDMYSNAYDYWGFYNGYYNHATVMPTVTGIYTGANRNPSTASLENCLTYVYLPSGGYIKYDYEPNDRQQYYYGAGDDNSTKTVSGTTGTSSNPIILSQVFNNEQELVFTIPTSFSRSGTPPLSGTCNLICNIKNSGGTVLIADTFSLYDLFYKGMATWNFNLANGAYTMQTLLTGGGTITSTYTFNITTQNKDSVLTTVPTTVGGIRIKRITRSNPSDSTGKESIITDYQYTTSLGGSSGFLGDIPVYSYPVTKFYTTHTYNYNLISSDPVNAVNSVDGNPVCYSMVTVFKGTSTHNLGKTVYEFTNLQDVNSNYFPNLFPYIPQDLKDWGLGLPKRISAYDSLGNLVRRTTNIYAFNANSFNNSNFQSLKLERNATTYTVDPIANPYAMGSNSYIGQLYYPTGGWASLTNTTDTLYNTDRSIQTSSSSYLYDTSFNVTQITSNYDRTRGLNLQTNFYYPYNYTVSGSTAVGKMRDSGIITPVIATEKWITGDGNTRMISGTITDYEQLSQGYMRPVTQYLLQSNAPVPQSVIGVFNGSQINRNTTYFVAQQTFPWYDSKGDVLESSNAVTGINSTVLMDYNKEYPIAKISNAAFTDVAYTSFESDGTGNWVFTSVTIDSSGGLTGKFAGKLASGSTIVKSGLSSSTTYILSVWAKTGVTVSANGTALSGSIAQQNGWQLYTKTITGVTSISVTGVGSIDELRLYPKDANMVTYTYEPLIGATGVCDANNTVIYTTYDNLNRVKLILDKDKNILKRYDYTDSAILINLLPRWVAIQRICDLSGPAYDSIYVDSNFYSYSYLVKDTLMKGYDCSGVCPDPNPLQYKVVNGTCEQGVQTFYSSVYDSKTGIWMCGWKYRFSDGSYSAVFYTYSSSGCTITPP